MHAPEPSLRERGAKWVRRHPRLTSGASIVALVFGLAATAAILWYAAARYHDRLIALETLDGFRRDVEAAQFLVYGRTGDRDQLDKGVAQCRHALDHYRVLENEAWHEASIVRALPDNARDELRHGVGELLFLSARATALKAQQTSRDRAQQLAAALHFNEAAESCFESNRKPRAVLEQRGELLAMLGKQEAAELALQAARQTPLQTAQDRYLLAHCYARKGKYRDALPLLEEATRLDPQNFSAWFVKGNCHDSLLQYAEAAACYSTAIALRPGFQWGWFNRGLAYLRLSRPRQARADFDRALELNPNMAEAYLNRGLARQALNDFPGAIGDLDRALMLRIPKTQIYFLRAQVRQQAGDGVGARRDREAGLLQVPSDEASWLYHGFARMDSDPAGALADFDEALALNPLSYPAPQNKAHVLGEKLRRDQAAVAIPDQAVALYPDSALPRAGRGVHLARIGKWHAALRDAEAALLLDTEPPNLYQVACIYALVSQTHPEHRFRALELLALALKSGYGLDLVDSDSDLQPLRKDAEFLRVVGAARALKRERSGS